MKPPHIPPRYSETGTITGKTGIFGIFGSPIAHTLSPVMHNAAFQALGLPYRYLPFQVRPKNLKKAVEGIIPLGIGGINVTIPHKETVLPLLDSVDSEAQKIGAVNTVVVASDRLIGHNTDGRGFLASLFEGDIDPTGKRVILVGAGGAARGVAIALAAAGASEMILIARTSSRGKELADRLAALSPRLKVSVLGTDFEKESPFRQGRPTLLVNTTPLGMKEGDLLPFPASLLDPAWIVADLIYRPYETLLLSAAKKIGAKTVSGLGMLLHQGALAFELWTKEKPPLQIMRSSLYEALDSGNPSPLLRSGP